MRAIFSGISMFVALLVLLFWAEEDWLWLFNVLFQFGLFIILGKLVFSCAFFLSALFNSGPPIVMGGAFMLSIFFRGMLRLLFHLDMEAAFPIVGACHGIPYTLLYAAVVYFLILLLFNRGRVSTC